MTLHGDITLDDYTIGTWCIRHVQGDRYLCSLTLNGESFGPFELEHVYSDGVALLISRALAQLGKKD